MKKQKEVTADEMAKIMFGPNIVKVEDIVFSEPSKEVLELKPERINIIKRKKK